MEDEDKYPFGYRLLHAFANAGRTRCVEKDYTYECLVTCPRFHQTIYARYLLRIEIDARRGHYLKFYLGNDGSHRASCTCGKWKIFSYEPHRKPVVIEHHFDHVQEASIAASDEILRKYKRKRS